MISSRRRECSTSDNKILDISSMSTCYDSLHFDWLTLNWKCFPCCCFLWKKFVIIAEYIVKLINFNESTYVGYVVSEYREDLIKSGHRALVGLPKIRWPRHQLAPRALLVPIGRPDNGSQRLYTFKERGKLRSFLSNQFQTQQSAGKNKKLMRKKLIERDLIGLKKRTWTISHSIGSMCV